jgi:transcriptional regulator with XRE-family HTH domain
LLKSNKLVAVDTLIKGGFMLNNDVLKRIKEVMVDKNLTQEKLAEMMGITQTQVSAWFTGRRNLSLESIKKIAKATNTPLEFFLTEGNRWEHSGNIGKNSVVGQNISATQNDDIQEIKNTVLFLKKDNETMKAKMDLLIELVKNERGRDRK